MIVSTTLAGPGAESTIGDALRSVAGLADKCLLILSGCDVEATIAAAKASAGDQLVLSHLDWPADYGKARNFALRAAEAIGATWALTLDCDERIQLDPGQLSLLNLGGFDAFSLPDRDLLYQKPRFIRCGAGASWWGICHERLTTNGGQGVLEGAFWELPKAQDAEDRRWQRGLEAVPRMLAEKDCPHLRRHLAECLMSAGRMPEAKEQFARVLADPATPLWERTWCRYRQAEFEVDAGHYEAARAIASDALARDPGFIQELGWVLAHCAAKLREFQTAALWATYALHAPIDHSRGGHRSITWKEGCSDLLARIQEAAQRMAPPEVMSAEHFASRDSFRPEYAQLARALVATLQPEDHLDLGAGNGLLVEAMQGCRVFSQGLEQSFEAEAHCGELAASCILFGAGVERWGYGPRHDLVTCVEVLEHMPAARAGEAVASICSRASRWVYLSAAQPGQGGIGHVNEQPPEYWVGKFSTHDFALDMGATEALRVRIRDFKRCWWLPRNALIFKRSGAES